MNIAIVFAGGSGVRMGTGIPKQFLEVNGKPIIVHTLQLFQYHREIDKIYVSTIKEYISYVEELVQEYRLTKVQAIVAGGDSAQESIYNGLKKSAEENDGESIVLLHDGVRPFVSYEVISNNIDSVLKNGNAITCMPCNETILISKDGKLVNDVPKRNISFTAQAPQSFYLKDIIDAHEKIRSRDTGYENMVDACTIYNTLGLDVFLIEGNRGNIKVTTPEDVYIFQALIRYKENEQVFGFGLTNNSNSKLSYYRVNDDEKM